MGSESISLQKRHYDISMSKRTRKPATIRDEVQNLASKRDDIDRLLPGDLQRSATKGFENSDHKSLKQLINGEEREKMERDEGSRGRSSLGQHFTEEENNNNNLQIVRRKQEDGVKVKKMVGNFLRSLIKGGEKKQVKKLKKKPFI